LEQITKPPFLNNELLGRMIRREDYYLPTYHETLDTPILSNSFEDVTQYKPTYYTTLTGYMDGFINPYKEEVDSAAQLAKGHFVNSPILKLLQIALNPNFNMTVPSRRIMLMEKPSKVDFLSKGYQQKEYDYSYEYALPASWNREQIRQRMLADIQSFTDFNARIITRRMPCLIIKRANKRIAETKFKTSGPKTVIDGVTQGSALSADRSPSGAKNYLQARKMRTLVFMLNNTKEATIPFAIDETGIEYAVDLDLPDNLTDLEEWKRTLSKQGINLVQEERMIEMFVMGDRVIDEAIVKSTPLKLTSSGYILKGGPSHE
jgi:hypothetical protein